jgi:hypothetical protein
MDTQEDFEFLKNLEDTDPEFVRQYIGGIKPVMIATSGENLLTVKECAADIGVCKNSILNYIKSGKIKAEFIDSQWQIKESDFLSFKSSFSIIRGNVRSRLIAGGNGKSTITVKREFVRRSPPQTGLVTDFLHNWPKKGCAGFHLSTICRDYNRTAEHKLNEEQMSGVLSGLARKGIVLRKGKGTYQVSPSIASVDSGPIDVAPQPIDSDFSPKTSERLAVESFVLENADSQVDFHFSISDLARNFPHLDRRKLCKACSNMYHYGKLKKGVANGDYVKRGKNRATSQPIQAIQAIQTVQSASVLNGSMDSVKKIMDSNLD